MTQDTAPAISARGLRKAFGRIRALDGLDLDVNTGENFGLLGPNGSGKTTFIRTVVGLVRPDAGSVQVLGRPARDGAAHEIGYMTQSPALYDDLTVAENVAFFARLYGVPAAEIREAVSRVIALVELEARRTSPVRQLSGGMRQRTNLACALVHGPRLLLLDEPTVGVDPELRISLWDHFYDLNRAGTTLVVSTHVMEEAERCGRIALLRAGRVLAVGTPADIKARAGAATVEEAYLRLSARAEAVADTTAGGG